MSGQKRERDALDREDAPFTDTKKQKAAWMAGGAICYQLSTERHKIYRTSLGAKETVSGLKRRLCAQHALPVENVRIMQKCPDGIYAFLEHEQDVVCDLLDAGQENHQFIVHVRVVHNCRVM